MNHHLCWWKTWLNWGSEHTGSTLSRAYWTSDWARSGDRYALPGAIWRSSSAQRQTRGDGRMVTAVMAPWFVVPQFVSGLLVSNYNFTIEVFMVVVTIVTGIYKAPYYYGTPHCKSSNWYELCWFSLAGGWAYPSKNMSSSVGMMTFPTEWKNESSKPPTSSDFDGFWHSRNRILHDFAL